MTWKKGPAALGRMTLRLPGSHLEQAPTPGRSHEACTLVRPPSGGADITQGAALPAPGRHLEKVAALQAGLTLTTLAALIPKDLPVELRLIDEGAPTCPMTLRPTSSGSRSSPARPCGPTSWPIGIGPAASRWCSAARTSPWCLTTPSPTRIPSSWVTRGRLAPAPSRCLGRHARPHRQAPELDIGGRPFPSPRPAPEFSLSHQQRV